MVADDLVAKILSNVQNNSNGVDQEELKLSLLNMLSDYNIKERDDTGHAPDISEKIDTFIACRALDGISESTLRNYKYHLVRFANHINKFTAAITTADIREYLSFIVETKRIKSSTVEEEKSIIKAFFAWLETEEYITSNPAKRIRPTRLDKKVRNSLSTEEIERMRAACSTPRERCMLEIFYSTGVRVSELSKIDITNLNIAENSIRVMGKGRKERIVFFSDQAKVYLKKYLRTRGPFPTMALFVQSKSPHNRMGPRSIQNEIAKIARNAGIDQRVFPHLLRHSFATHGLKSGMSLKTLQELMGHSKIDTTMVYLDSDMATTVYEYQRAHCQ